MRKDARISQARTLRIARGSFLAAASITAFGAGMLTQQALMPKGPHVSPAVRLAQVSQAHGVGQKFAGSRRHAVESSPDDPAATLETVYSLVKEHYVDALPSDSVMSHGALRSLLSTLHDPNAFFLEPAQRTLLENEAQGKFGGIGASLFVRPVPVNGYTEHKIEIVSVLPGSPAQNAGLRSHDIITHIDGKWILGTDPFLKVDSLVARLQAANQNSDTEEVERATDEARRRASGGIGLVRAQMALRGDRSTLDLYRLPVDRLTLTVLSPGSKLSRTVVVEPRETIADSVTVSLAPGGATVIKVLAFDSATFDSVRKALESTPISSKGILLDLRGNSGGIGSGGGALGIAQKLASLLISSGHSEGAEFAIERLPGGRSLTLRTASVGNAGLSDPTSCAAAPIVALVDGGTAGAAEALAAELCDSGRAILAGQQSFGYAGVQTIYNLPDGSAFTLSTGLLSSPKHVEWSGRGLTPSVVLSSAASEAENLKRAASLLAGQPPARIAAAPISH